MAKNKQDMIFYESGEQNQANNHQQKLTETTQLLRLKVEVASQHRIGLNLSNILNTSWGWTGGWQRLRSAAVACTPSPRPSRCRTRTGTACSAAGEAGLSIHRWPSCIPRRDLLVSPWPDLVPLRSSERTGHPPSAAATAAASSQDKRSLILPVLTSPLGHKVIFHQGSQPQGLLKLCGAMRVDTRLSAPSLPDSLPLRLPLSISNPHPTPPLLFFFSQLINYSVSVSHPHMNQAMSRG